MRVSAITFLIAFAPCVAASEEQKTIEIALLCVATSEHAKQLGGVALGFGKSPELASYMWSELDEKLSQKADALSIVGGRLTQGILLHPELGLGNMRSKAFTCSQGAECDTQLFMQAIVFSEKILEFCREDANGATQ